jgi:hypothetical protein
MKEHAKGEIDGIQYPVVQALELVPRVFTDYVQPSERPPSTKLGPLWLLTCTGNTQETAILG